MAEEQLRTFLAAPIQDRLRLALDKLYADEIRSYLGVQAFEEYAAIAQRVTGVLAQQHLGIQPPTNLLFVPGVMGSLLQSRTLGGVWWIDWRTRHHLNDMRLAEDGQTDANPAFAIVPFSTDITYEPFLAAILERDDFGHALFPYDWRKPFTFSTRALRDKVLALYESNGHEPIHLVTHSMGGLLVRATLMQHGDELWPKLGRIVFIGTPHYGSPAIAGYLKNHLWGFELMALLGIFLNRATFRSLWGVLTMLPAPLGIYPATRQIDADLLPAGEPYPHPCVNFDLYNAEAWQLGLSLSESANLQVILDRARVFHQRLYDAHQNLEQDLRQRMAVIAGVGYNTLFRLANPSRFLGQWDNISKEFTREPGNPHREGDGRVPLASAELENVGEIRYAKGVHGGLPMLPTVYEDVFRWLNEEPMRLPDTPSEALSQHLAGGATIGEAPHLDGTARGNVVSGDPGYWALTLPDSARLTELADQLNAGQLPEFNLVRLL